MTSNHGRGELKVSCDIWCTMFTCLSPTTALRRAIAAAVLVLLTAPSWGQARRDVVQGTPQDLVWYEDVESAIAAQSQGERVLALDLSRQRLRALPERLQELDDLTYLLLNKNRLQSLPSWLANMGSVEALVADHNRFNEFPSVLLEMPQIAQLSLGENYLRGIPLDIDKMKGLQILSLWGNVLASFPASLGDLSRLTILDLLHNEMTMDEQSFLKELLPNVEINMSEPCNCEFQTGFVTYPSD